MRSLHLLLAESIPNVPWCFSLCSPFVDSIRISDTQQGSSVFS